MLSFPSDDHNSLLQILRNYYQSQSYLPQGLSGRVSSLSENYINLSIVAFQAQQEKELAVLGEKELEEKDSKEKEKEKESNDEADKAKENPIEPRDERLASYEALHTVKESIALEDLFAKQKKTGVAVHRILVLGRAGIGKTTVIRLIAEKWGRKELLSQFRYLFCVSLRNLNQPHYINNPSLTFAAVIHRECCQGDSQIDVADLEQLLAEKADEILVVLDGWDEAADLAKDRSTPIAQVLQQALNFPNLLVTSRPYAVPEDIAFDRCVENMGFTPENINAYVKTYFAHPDLQQSAQAELLLSFLKTNPNIWGMAHVPINLALVCNAWEETQRQGQSLNVRLQLTGLYQNLIRYLLRRSLEREGAPVYDKDNAWIERRCLPQTSLLETLAIAGLTKQQLILSPALQQSVVASDEAFAAALRLGLLQPVGQPQAYATDQAHYFLHLTFQEFFAARYMVRGLGKASHTAHHQEVLTFIREYKYDPRYAIVFWFMAGLVSAETRQNRSLQIFWDTLLAAPRDLLGVAHMRLIIRCLDEAQCDKRIVQREQMLSDISQWLRAMAFHDIPAGPLLSALDQSLMVLQEPVILEEVLAVCQHRDNKVRLRAFYTLYSFACPPNKVIQMLLQSCTDEDKHVRQAALRALGRIANFSETIIKALIQGSKDEDKYVRLEVLEILGQIPKPSGAIIQALLQGCEDEDSWVRHTAFKMLGRTPNSSETIIETLIRECKDEKQYVRQKALETLGQISNPSEAIIQALLQGCEDEDSCVRDTAFEMLGRIPKPSGAIIQALLQGCEDEDIWVRGTAFKMLGRIPNPSGKIIEALLRGCEDEIDRYVAKQALDKINNPSEAGIQVLLKGSENNNKHVKEGALRGLRHVPQAVLGHISNPSEKLTKEFQESNDAEMYMSAVLESLKNTPGLADSSEDEEEEHEGHEDEDILISNPSKELTKEFQESNGADLSMSVVLESLKNIPGLADSSEGEEREHEGHENEEILISNPSGKVVKEFQESNTAEMFGPVESEILKNISGSDDDEEDILSFLQEYKNNPVIREGAYTQLGALPNSSKIVIQTLLQGCADENRDICNSSLEALEKINNLSEEGIQVLLQECKNSNSEVRRGAVTGLGRVSDPAKAKTIFEALLQGCEDHNWDVSHTAMRSLRNIHIQRVPAAAIEILLHGSIHKNSDVRRSAFSFLSKLSNPAEAVIQALLRGCKDKDNDVRKIALEGLEPIPKFTEAVIQALLNGCKDKEKDVRCAALTGLKLISNPTETIIQALLHGCRDKERDVRWAALKGLKQIPNPTEAIIQALLRGFKDKDKYVRLAALAGLKRIPNPSEEVFHALFHAFFQELEKPEPNKWDALKELCQICQNSEAGIKALIWKFKKGDVHEQCQIMDALKKIPNLPVSIIHVIVQKCADNNQFIELYALRVISACFSIPEHVIKFLIHQPSVFKLPIFAERPSFPYEKHKQLNTTEASQFLTLGLFFNNSLGHLQRLITILFAADIVLSIRKDRQIYLNQQLFQPVLPYVRIPEDFVKALCEAMKECISQYQLPSISNHLPQKRISALDLNMLANNTDHLILSHAALDDSHIIPAIVAVLKHNRNLKFVHLQDNHFTDQGACAIARALRYSNVTELQLQHNPIGEKAALAFINLLQGSNSNSKGRSSWWGKQSETPTKIPPNTRLRTLSLTRHSLSQETQSNLTGLLERNQQQWRLEKQLLKAVKQNDREAVDEALRNGAFLGAMNRHGQGILHLAAQLGYRELVTYLITQAEFRCSVDTLNRKGVTAFYVACAAGQWGIAQDLLAQGTKLTVQDHQGRTLLHHAVLDQEPTVLTYLLTDPRFKKIRVSLVNIPDLHGQTPLHCAIQQEDEKLVRQLLYAGANANLVNQAGETPSDLAYRTGNLCLIGYLKNAEYIALPVADDPVPMPTTWVRIRVWSAQEHISCETPELNLHLWLANDANPDVSVDEGQDQPDIDIVLYSLQLAALHAAFNQLYQRDPYWFLSGRDKFAANQPNISEVVFDLLLAGGISHLVGMAAVSDNKTINVNAVMTLLRRAKQAEQEKYLDLHADEAVFVTQAALVHITQAHYQLLLAEFRSKLPENEHSLWLPWLQEIVATKPSTQDIPFVIAAQDFTKGRELGRGGFGVVYQGQHHEKVVAIKQLLSFKQEYIKDFMTEVAVMAQLDHPCIVTCFGVCLEKQYSIVMEYMPGGSLHALLQAHRNEIETWDVEWRVRFPIMQDVSNGLAFLHRYYPKAILHCDLKPENVLLAPEGGAKLADFGLAQFKGEMSTYSACNEHGTHGFMAPELFEEYAKFSKASDVFSLGMLFWVMTACKKPFANFTMAIAATQQLLKGNREVFAFGTAPRIVALIQHCWLQEPQKRPDMQDIHRLLSQGYDSFFAHSSPVITAETILSFPAEQGVQEWLHESYYREEGSMIIKLENETTLSMQLLSEEFSIPTTNSILVDLTKYIITAVGERHVLLSQVAEGITTLSFTSIPALQAVLRLLESEGFPRPIAASALPQYHCN